MIAMGISDPPRPAFFATHAGSHRASWHLLGHSVDVRIHQPPDRIVQAASVAVVVPDVAHVLASWLTTPASQRNLDATSGRASTPCRWPVASRVRGMSRLHYQRDID